MNSGEYSRRRKWLNESSQEKVESPERESGVNGCWACSICMYILLGLLSKLARGIVPLLLDAHGIQAVSEREAHVPGH